MCVWGRAGGGRVAGVVVGIWPGVCGGGDGGRVVRGGGGRNGVMRTETKAKCGV